MEGEKRGDKREESQLDMTWRLRKAEVLPLMTLVLEALHWSVRVCLGETQCSIHFYRLLHTGRMASAPHLPLPPIVGAGHELMQFNGITRFFFVALRDMRLN